MTILVTLRPLHVPARLRTRLFTVKCHTPNRINAGLPSHCGRAACSYRATSRHMATSLRSVLEHVDLVRGPEHQPAIGAEFEA